MKTSPRRLSIMLACSLITLFLAGGNTQGDPILQAKADENLAADFVLKDLDGRDVRLSDYRGKTVLLYFMATWCPECREAIPRLKEIYALYKEKGLVVLSVDVLESKKKAEAFSKKYALPYPTLLDEDGRISRLYGVVGVPVKALIDRQGRIICWNCRSFEALLAKQF